MTTAYSVFIGYSEPEALEAKHAIILPALTQAGFTETEDWSGTVHIVPDADALRRVEQFVASVNDLLGLTEGCTVDAEEISASEAEPAVVGE